MKKSEVIILSVVILSFILGVCLYSQMPDQMASHWNIKGQVDNYISKSWGLFLMPLITLGIFLIFLIIPRIDPLKENIEKFRKYFNSFIVIIALFLFYLYVLTILWNFGISFNINRFMPPAFAVLLFYAGVLIGKSERNWFIGIRTPWTLSDEKVWKKTHRIGEELFKISGVIALLGILFPNYFVYLLVVPVLLSAIYTFVYSYFAYKKRSLDG